VRQLWGIRHGDFREFYSSQPLIAHHPDFILYPLALLDGILPPAHGILVVQTLALALTAVPAYRLGERHLGGPWGGLCAGVTVLLYPVLGQVNVFEAHPLALAVAPALWAFEALDRNAGREAALATVLVVLCKEDGLLFAALLPWVRTPRRRGRALAITVVCLSLYAGYAFVLKPAIGAPNQVRAHFGALGSTPNQVMVSLLSHPLGTLARAFDRPRLLYLAALLWPLAFLPLGAPRLLLPIVPLVAINLVALMPARFQVVDSYYSALILPSLFAAAVVAGGRAARRLGRSPVWAGLLLLLAAGAGAARLGAFPGAGGHFAADYRDDARAVAMRALVAPMLARPDASVSAPLDVVAHLAQRAEPFIFPRGVDHADFALAEIGTQVPIEAPSLHAYQESVRRTVSELLRSGRMKLIEARGPIALLGRVPR
jgi:hypothetical protein